MSNASQPEGGERKATGRPPSYTIEDKRAIFARMVDGIENGRTLRDALKDAGSQWGVMCRWLADDRNTTEEGESFGARYARARVHSAALYADKAITVVEDAPKDKVEMMRARLLQDGYKWRASVADPKGYGAQPTNKVEVNVSLGSLHLDALRKVTASAKVLEPSQPKSLPSTTVEAEVQAIGEPSSVPIQGE